MITARPCCAPGRQGFTLLELLVSMFVLALIVIGCAMLYHQASLAYEAGVDRTETTMLGRGVVQLMAAEISDAVGSIPAEPIYPNLSGWDSAFVFSLSPSTIDFARLTTSYEGSQGLGRSVVRVTYRHDSTRNLLVREMKAYTNEVYGLPQQVSNFAIATNVYDLRLVADPAWGGTNGLPRFVDIEVDILLNEYAKLGPSEAHPEIADHKMTYHARANLVNRNCYK